MYNSLKNTVYTLLPEHYVLKNKDKLRKTLARFYKGSTYHCNLCGFNMRSFIITNNNLRICPNCGGLSRTRRLWEILKPEINHKTVLHFSPNEALVTKIKETKFKSYITSDYDGEFKADKSFNIERIEEIDNSYDIIICYHILEHVENDKKAMKELYRILKPNGKVYIQTPFKEGDIYENSNMTSKLDRLKHFGQEDHVRIYSIDGILKRLESVGFKTKTLKYNEAKDNRIGLDEHEHVIIATKELTKPKPEY